MNKPVPNLFPTLHGLPYRIAFIGEAPGEDEEACGLPFVGASGRLLSGMMNRVGIARDACLIANVCQYRPPGNKIEAFAWDDERMQASQAALVVDINKFKPNLCVLLGNTPLRMFMGSKESVENWRGSLFIGLDTWKCMATIHPAACLREYSYTPMLHFDLRRAAVEGRTKELNLPQRNLNVDCDIEHIICQLEQIKREKPLISIDIEGGINSMSCLSIAQSANNAFIVPFTGLGQSESRLWKAIACVLTDSAIPKVLQNSLYDLFVLQYSYNIPVRGIVDDTMLKHWELYCELPKSLGFQTSIYTKEPFYKDDRGAEDRATFYGYCCKDSAVTYEINEVLSGQLRGDQLTHYKLNLALLEPLLYMELKGILYDKEKASARLVEIESLIHRLQWALNEVAGFPRKSKQEWFITCADTFCFVRQRSSVTSVEQIIGNCKTTVLNEAQEACNILHKESLSLSDQGQLAMLTDCGLNVESKLQLADYLYRTLQLPIQYKKLHGRKTDKETTDALALLTLYKQTSNPILKLILTIRGLRTRCDALRASTDTDGRIRCGYNIVGTETGRLSCYESPTGSGFNLQTVTKKDRDLFTADPGWFMFQCDLAGADGWTVAAHSASCGDPTMLEDYLYGLKPAKILSLVAQYGSIVNTWDRAKLKERSKEINQDDWMYFARKRVQHGSNYGMKGQTMSDQIVKDSYKLFGEPVLVSKVDCEREQHCYFQRYTGVLSWHERIKWQLKEYGYLISASGHKRIFFGRRDDHDTFKAACSDEPQNNTSYATNLAIYRLWSDPENRLQETRPNDNSENDINRMASLHRDSQSGVHDTEEPLRIDKSFTQTKEHDQSTWSDKSVRARTILRIQPLHQVHDAIIGQFRKENVTWALPKIRQWFANPIRIAGKEITIPFEGAYGTSWGNLKEGTI